MGKKTNDRDLMDEVARVLDRRSTKANLSLVPDPGPTSRFGPTPQPRASDSTNHLIYRLGGTA